MRMEKDRFLQQLNEISKLVKRSEAEKKNIGHFPFSAMNKVFMLIRLCTNNYKVTI